MIGTEVTHGDGLGNQLFRYVTARCIAKDRGEEFGILGVIIVSILFLTILYRGIKIALNCKENFPKYLAFGMIFQILIQAVMNLMVVIGLIPVTGVTLPFLSYGGSSLLITLVSIGILLNISRGQK